MKVDLEVQYLCTPEPRGISNYIINLSKSLVQRNRNNYSLSFFDYNKERGNIDFIESYLDDETLNKITIHECNHFSYETIMQSNIVGNRKGCGEVSYRYLMKSNSDVVHFTQSLYLPYNIAEKAVVTVHDVIPLLHNAQEFCKERTIQAFVNNVRFLEERKDIEIIADSQFTKMDLMKYSNISSERIHVVPLGFDRNSSYPNKNKMLLEGMGIEGRYVLYLGALDNRKGVVDIFQAFKRIREKGYKVKLVLAGGKDPNVFKVIEELKFHQFVGDIILPGFVTDDQKRVLLSCAEAFLFPSEYEGFGLPVLEAMACGAPVITTNVSSLPEVGGDAAMYVSPKNPEELAMAIEKMLSSESLRQEYIAKGFEQCKKFSWDKTAEMTEEVYKMVYNR